MKFTVKSTTLEKLPEGSIFMYNGEYYIKCTRMSAVDIDKCTVMKLSSNTVINMMGTHGVTPAPYKLEIGSDIEVGD